MSNDDERTLVSELATVVNDPGKAKVLLTHADFPMARMPKFDTPTVFWVEVVEEARNGVLPGGIRPLIEQAAMLYPDNPVFARLRGGHEAKQTARFSLAASPTSPGTGGSGTSTAFEGGQGGHGGEIASGGGGGGTALGRGGAGGQGAADGGGGGGGGGGGLVQGGAGGSGGRGAGGGGGGGGGPPILPVLAEIARMLGRTVEELAAEAGLDLKDPQMIYGGRGGRGGDGAGGAQGGEGGGGPPE